MLSDYSAHGHCDGARGRPANGGIGVDTDAERALRFRNLAHEIRERANCATSAHAREIFLKIAEGYDRAAKVIEDAENSRSGESHIIVAGGQRNWKSSENIWRKPRCAGCGQKRRLTRIYENYIWNRLRYGIGLPSAANGWCGCSGARHRDNARCRRSC